MKYKSLRNVYLLYFGGRNLYILTKLSLLYLYINRIYRMFYTHIYYIVINCNAELCKYNLM